MALVGATARLRAAARALRTPGNEVPQLFDAGVFYSPVVNAAQVLAEPDRSRVWPVQPEDPLGFDVREADQLELLAALKAYPLPDPSAWPQPSYDPSNDQFPPQDAALLYGMIRHHRPSRVVEVGCGWSTTVTARAIADGALSTSLVCIDPYPRDFLSDVPRIELRQEKVEHTPMAVFEALGPGDVLFIDSSHVVKTGSDVVHLVLRVLPRLNEGVVVHVHDVFIPEDYPIGWVKAGFGWNEQYMVQAYLVGNRRAEILAMNHWLSIRHPEAVTSAFGEVPFHGSSLWFRLRVDPELDQSG